MCCYMVYGPVDEQHINWNPILLLRHWKFDVLMASDSQPPTYISHSALLMNDHHTSISTGCGYCETAPKLTVKIKKQAYHRGEAFRILDWLWSTTIHDSMQCQRGFYGSDHWLLLLPSLKYSINCWQRASFHISGERLLSSRYLMCKSSAVRGDSRLIMIIVYSKSIACIY
jgi:hypothetical protein